LNPRGASAWAAIPDGLTAAAFVAIWISPFVFGELSVKTAMLIMLVEFFLIHGTGFFTAIGEMRDVPRGKRVLGMLGLSLVYVLMISAVAWSFGEWWPLLAFGWLLVGKILWTWGVRADGKDTISLQMAAWAGSVVAYLFGCFLTVLLPVPRLGMQADLQPSFGLGEDSGGLWIDEPHRVVAFGAIYFALLCAGKLVMARRGAKG
jgi:hypothetical protein